MKRLITVVFLLGLIALVYQFCVTFLMFKHTSNYSIKQGDDSYLITENFIKNGAHHFYTFYIEDKNKVPFLFSYDINLNKQSRIIQKIETYSNGGLYCLAPVLKGNRVDDVQCSLNNQLLSYSYLKQAHSGDLTNFITQIKTKYNFNEELEKEYTIKDTEYNLSIYKEIPDNIYFSIWGYNSVYSLSNKEIRQQDLLYHDSYFNENLSILVDKYYITLNTDNYSNNSFFIVNIKDGGKSIVDTNYEVSRNIYFNGIYDKKAYFTDPDNKRQYYMDPYEEEVKEVGTSDQAKFFNGTKLVNVDVYTLSTEKKYFEEPNIPKKLKEKYPDKKLIESYGNYYYLDGDGSVYQIVGEYYDNKIKLFQLEGFKELKVRNNNVYGIYGDTVYMYNHQIGLKKALEDRELLYNYKNIYDVYEGW